MKFVINIIVNITFIIHYRLFINLVFKLFLFFNKLIFYSIAVLLRKWHTYTISTHILK